jgi:S1-C subfamily serine protease
MASVSLLFAGCSPFHTTTKSWIHVEDGEQVTISHAPLLNGGNWSLGGAPSYREVGLHEAEVRLENRAELELIALSAEGCFPMHHLVEANRYNSWKFADLSGFATGIAMMARGESTERPEALIGGGFFIAFGNFVAFWMRPKHVFPGSFEFTSPLPMPKATEHFMSMEFGGFDFNVAAGNHRWTYFEDLKGYERGRWIGRNESRKSAKLEGTNLGVDIQATLRQQGYIAPASASMLRPEGTWKIHGELTEIEETRLARAIQYTATSRWWVEHPFGMPVDTVQIVSNSTWHLYSTGDLGFNREALIDAMNHAALKAAEDDGILEDAQNLAKADSIWSAEWSPIALKPAQQAPGRVAQAVNSIVTIQDESGHGSGCILDSDGWILTNHHVASDTATAYDVIMHDGTTIKGRMVRYHPVWDLALVKVDTTGLTPFRMDAAELPELGEDVFAIGTPYDTGLGATLTRGIVSGKRKDGPCTLIQTDVSISPGNSGGALTRPDGTLVGIITEKVMDRGVEGIGFAMPITDLPRLLGVTFE